MAVTPSNMLPLGTKAPDFELPDTEGRIVSRDDFRDSPALVVVFMCNHCPYVKHVRSHLVELIKEYQKRGVGVVGINANDAESFPEDSPENQFPLSSGLPSDATSNGRPGTNRITLHTDNAQKGHSLLHQTKKHIQFAFLAI